MIPDYSSTPEQARDTMRLFIKPELLSKLQVERSYGSKLRSRELYSSILIYIKMNANSVPWPGLCLLIG